MRMKLLTALAAATALAGCGPQTHSSGDSKRFEAYCNLQGFAPSLRQTVIVIDENVVTPNPQAGSLAPENLAWTRWLGAMTGASGSSTSTPFAPRERLSLYMAPKDGSAPKLVFTGCLPGFSAEEVQALARKQGGLSTATKSYFGSGLNETATKDAKKFNALFGAAVAKMADPGALSNRGVGGSDLGASSLMDSLRHGGVVNLEAGVPRVMIYTNLSRFSSPWSDVPAARKAGFEAAKQAPIDLKRADVYVAGPNGGAGSDKLKEYADAFLLGSGGALKGWGVSDAPASEPAPQHVRVFSGLVRFGSEDVPVRLRLGTTDSGRIVSSWISVRRDVETATPFTGEIVNDGQGGEIGKNDGRGLGQLWSLNPDPTPEWGSEMAFGGLRNIEFQIAPDGSLTGKVSDPMVSAIKGNATPYLRFTLHLDPKAVF